MKKRIKVLTLCTLIVITSLSVCLLVKSENVENVFTMGSSTYALYLNDEAISEIPEGEYYVLVDCENASGYWDYEESTLRIENPADGAFCTVDFYDQLNKNISDYITTELADKEVEGVEGYVVHETYTNTDGETVDTGYRYEGNDPNNYVYFNGEIWRIIGVFETYTVDEDGNVSSSPEMLTKLIDPDGIGGYSWDTGSNEWGGYNTIYDSANLYKILNNYYYNSTDGTTSGYCYLYSSTIVGDCNFTESGISDGYRDLIENVVWYTGGIQSASYASVFYEAERGTTTYLNSRSTTATGYIGLLYVSDYGYSVLESSCARTTSVGSYSSSLCAGSSWMMFGETLWTMVPDSSGAGKIWIVNYVGNTGYSSDNNVFGYFVHPTLYLNSDAKIIGGDGSYESPYVLSIG